MSAAADFHTAPTQSTASQHHQQQNLLARRASLISRSHATPVQSVAAAQEAATKAWRSDLRSLLTRAEERFADVCWTTALPEDGDQADTASLSDAASNTRRVLADWNFEDRAKAGTHNGDGQHTIIWAHKAILYARAPNTFQARYLQLRSPATQLGYNASNASLVSLPTLPTDGPTPQQSRSTTPTSLATTASARSRKSIRGSKPPSSFAMKRSSLRIPSRSSQADSTGLKAPSSNFDDAASLTSGIMTSDSEPEGLTLLCTTSRSQASPDPATATATAATRGLVRMPSFASDTDSASRADSASILSQASTVRAPMSLNGVSQAYFEATLEFLYTGEESMVDAFEFLYEDRLATDADRSPAEKQEKLRSDMTFMWRSKLYSDVKIFLDTGDDGRRPDTDRTAMLDIPDANISMLSLPQTVDTDRIEDSEDEDDELTSFSSHRMILASRSPYFASMFLSPYADSQAPVVKLPSPPFTAASLHFTLGFLYTGTLFFSNRTFDLTTAIQLWRAGAYLQVETLQHLIAAMIAQDFCHNFACSPPCRKCLKRVPRTLAFASSVDVSDADLAGMAISAITGRDFGIYWAKEVGNLHSTLRDHIVNLVSERVESRPAQVISVLRQLSIVGRRIDTERASKWVESLRSMSEIIEARLLLVIRTRFEDIVKSREWADLIDGVGQLGDVLEKALVMLVDCLTEPRAPLTYQVLVGQVLLRDEGFEVQSSKQAVEDARGGILRYLKRRWINIRALGGFNGLEKWCLKELADELGVASADLILPRDPPVPELVKTRSGLRPAVAAGAGMSSPARAAPLQRRAGSLPGGAPLAAAAPPRQSAPATLSRLRTSSNASSGSATSRSASAGSAAAARADADSEREAGPVDLRAAVLNRNAARTSVANGHRSTLDSTPIRSTTARTAVASTRGEASTSLSSRSVAAASTRPPLSGTPATASTGRTRTASGVRAASSTASGVRSRTPSARPTPETAPAAVTNSTASVLSKASVGSLASTKSTALSSSRATAAATSKAGSLKARDSETAVSSSGARELESAETTSVATSSSVSRVPSPSDLSSEAAGGATATTASGRAAPAKAGTISAKNSSELLSTSAAAKSVRTTKSVVSLRTGSKLAATIASAPSLGSRSARPVSSLDKASTGGTSSGTTTTTASSLAQQAAKDRLIAKAGATSGSAATQPVIAGTSSGSGSPAAKHAFLKATPRPGGIFSLSSTDSGKGLRQRTLSGGGSSTKSTASGASKAVSRSVAAATKASSSATRTASAAAAAAVRVSSASAASSRAGSAASTSAANRVRTTVRAAPGTDRLGASKAAVGAKGASAAAAASPSIASKVSGLPSGGVDPSASEDEAELADDASAVTAVEGSIDVASDAEMDSDDAAAETARSNSGSDTEGGGDSFDPDETITTFPLPTPRLVVDPKALGTLPSPSPSAPLPPPSDGTTLFSGIPCIVSAPFSRTRKHAARFHATVKYIGPVHGWTGAWVGIEVALPLPTSLLPLMSSPSSEDGHGDDEMQGKVVCGGVGAGMDLSECPGGLHDGTVDGVRYFDLTMQWDLFQSTTMAFSGLPPPYSPNLAGTTVGGENEGGYLGIMSPSGRRSMTPTPQEMGKKKRSKYPERPERKQRRQMVLKKVHSDPDRTLNSEPEDEDEEYEGEEEASGEGTSKGLFIKPSDVLWVVSR